MLHGSKLSLCFCTIRPELKKLYERRNNMWDSLICWVCQLSRQTHMTLHRWYSFTQAAASTTAASCFLSCVTCCVSTYCRGKAVTCCFSSHSQLTQQYTQTKILNIVNQRYRPIMLGCNSFNFPTECVFLFLTKRSVTNMYYWYCQKHAFTLIN